MRIKVRTPASAGELLEGHVEGVRQLISLPINLYNELLIEYKTIEGTKSTDHRSLPELADHPKARAAMLLFYNLYELPHNAHYLSFVFSDAIVVGKGLASSTADILNMIYGLAYIHQIQLTPIEVAKIALQVEPSDSTMFDTLYLYDFIAGSRFEEIGIVPPFNILLLELPDIIDTLATYSKTLPTSHTLDDVIQEIRHNYSIQSLSKAAIQSALNHQEICHKPYLNRLIEFIDLHHLLGLNIAHSGSVIGIWCKEVNKTIEFKLFEAFTDIFIDAKWVRTVKGGTQIYIDN